MAKIHIKGGSPLRLRFEDDNGKDLKVTLDGPTKGVNKMWYNVKDEVGKILETKSGTDYNIFVVDAPHKPCKVIVDYPIT